MSLPIFTTQITIRNDATHDPFMPSTETIIASDVNAHIDHKSGTEVSNQRAEQQYAIYADIVDVDIPTTATILDQSNNAVYSIVYVHKYDTRNHPIFSFLAHMEIGANKVSGGVPL